MFEEDFDDGNYTGWSLSSGSTWSAANGYMANSRYASGISQFYRSRTVADAEFRYSYSNEDTSNSDYYVRTDLRYRTSGQATVEFLPSTVRIREWDGSTWYTRASASLTTTQGQWYDVIARISGSSITVERRPAGGEFEQVLTGTVNLATTTRAAFVASTNALIRVDNIRVIDGAMQSTYTMTYNNANELTQMSNSTQATTVAFTYDAWGRMVTKTQGNHLAAYRFRFGDKMTWTQSNFPDEAASVTMMYDGLGKRRYKYVSGTPNSTTYWWRWGAGLNVVNEYTDAESTWDWDPENLTATYVPDPAGMGSMAEIAGADPSSGAYRYYSGDNLGSVRRVRAQDKSSLAEYEYTPYGDAYSQSGLALNRGFTGHKWDSEIAMYWAPYRHYLPAQARWLTRDPLPSTNLYYYSYDPINSVDVLGLQSGEPIYNGCSPDQQNQMNAQLDQYCNKLNSSGFCSCMQDDSGLGGEMKRMCDNRGSMVISCEKPDSPHCQKNECARGNIGSSGIYMCPAAFNNPNCGPLGCSLMHEMAHNAGAPDDEEGGSRREGMAFNVGRCLGCS